MPKVKQSLIETILDSKTGEVLSRQENKVVSWGDEPPYVKMYLDSLLYLKDLPKGHNTILNEFLKRMTYAGNDEGQVIYVNSGLKNRISQILDVSVSRINNVLSDLVAGELFTRIDRGTYMVNANFFGKGDWQDIAKLRLKITFDEKGKTIMGEVEKKRDKESNKIVSHFDTVSLATKKQAPLSAPPKIIPTEKIAAANPVPLVAIPDCDICGTIKQEMTRKDGIKFFGCPNWREHKLEHYQTSREGSNFTQE